MKVTGLAAAFLVVSMVFVSQTAHAQSGEVKILSSYAYVDSIGFLNVVGEVQNNAASPVGFVTISATFYDSTGKVVGTGLTFAVMDVLRPGEKSPFNVLFTDSEQISAVENYKLQVSYRSVTAKPGVLQLRVGDGYMDSTGFYHLVGEVANLGTKTANFVTVAGAFYSSDGRVVAAGLTFTTPDSISPSQSAPFDLLVVSGDLSSIASASVNVKSREYASVFEQPTTPTKPEVSQQPPPGSQSPPASDKTYKAKLSLSASISEKTKTITLSLKNPKGSDAKVYELYVILPDDATAKSAVAPKGWSKEIDGDTVTFTTENSPINAGKSLRFKVTADRTVKTISWDALDDENNIINSKETKVTVRK